MKLLLFLLCPAILVYSASKILLLWNWAYCILKVSLTFSLLSRISENVRILQSYLNGSLMISYFLLESYTWHVLHVVVMYNHVSCMSIDFNQFILIKVSQRSIIMVSRRRTTQINEILDMRSRRKVCCWESKKYN